MIEAKNVLELIPRRNIYILAVHKRGDYLIKIGEITRLRATD